MIKSNFKIYPGKSSKVSEGCLRSDVMQKMKGMPAMCGPKHGPKMMGPGDGKKNKSKSVLKSSSTIQEARAKEMADFYINANSGNEKKNNNGVGLVSTKQKARNKAMAEFYIDANKNK